MLLASCCQWRPAGSGNVTNEAGDPDPAEVRTRLEREFVANLSNPGVQLAAMNWSDHDQCRWRCSNEGCGHEWTTRLVFRSRRRRPTGCPACSRRRNRAPGPGESLAELDPDLAKQFRRNLTRPDRGPETLRTQSHDLCEWECRKGHKWEATVANRTNGRGCRRCSGHGRSLFEYKVAMLVQAASGIGVEVDHRLRLPGRSEDAFDLFLKELDLLIDLDPAWTHSGQDSLARDTAKTEATLSAGRRLERIRERGLPPLPISGIAHYEAGPGVDPADWAEAVGYVVRRRGHPWKDLDSVEVIEALSEAARLWQEDLAKPKVSALDAAPHLEREFVENRTTPGRGLDQMPPGCNDLCAWRCLAPGCGNKWEVPLHVRALAGRGCRKCGWKRTGAANSRPGPGESLAEVNPTLAAELIEVIDHPGWTANDLLPNSNKVCLWRCPESECGSEYRCQPSQRTSQGRGCRECARRRSTAGRTRPKPGKSLHDKFPEIAAELIEVIDHPGWTANDLRPSSAKPCRWQCSQQNCPGVWEATADQRTRRGGTGMRCPLCHPRRKPPESP